MSSQTYSEKFRKLLAPVRKRAGWYLAQNQGGGGLLPVSFRAVIRRAVCGGSANPTAGAVVAHPAARCCALSVVLSAHPLLHAAAEVQPPHHCQFRKTLSCPFPKMHLP